jgi:hypothetical protein
MTFQKIKLSHDSPLKKVCLREKQFALDDYKGHPNKKH